MSCARASASSASTQLDDQLAERAPRAARGSSVPASIRASSNRSSTSAESISVWARIAGRYSAGVGEAVLDRFDHCAQRRNRCTQVVARPGDELAARVEEALDARGHLVEGGTELEQLTRAIDSEARALRSPEARSFDGGSQRVRAARGSWRPSTSAPPSAHSVDTTRDREDLASSCMPNITRPPSRHDPEREADDHQGERGELPLQGRQQAHDREQLRVPSPGRAQHEDEGESVSSLEPIADAPHGLEQLRPGGIAPRASHGAAGCAP